MVIGNLIEACYWHSL